MQGLRVQIHRALAYTHAALDEPAAAEEYLDYVRDSAAAVLADLRRCAPTETAGALEDLGQLTLALRELGRKLNLSARLPDLDRP
jgi:hypothetical protein